MSRITFLLLYLSWIPGAFSSATNTAAYQKRLVDRISESRNAKHMSNFVKKIVNQTIYHPLYPSMFDLPPPRQISRRILAVYCVHRVSSTEDEYMYNQLINYVEACNAGFEVHIHVISHFFPYSNLYLNSSLLYCNRTAATLPMSVQLQRHPSGFQGGAPSLPRASREVMYYFKGNYDFYIIQEDDAVVTVRNLLYLDKWSSFFQRYGNNYLPGFHHYEYRQADLDDGCIMRGTCRKYLPSYSLTAFALYNLGGMQFIQLRGMMQIMSVHTDRTLQLLESTGELFGDLDLYFYEPNVHFVRTWQLRHYR